jgi:hypothetical protein
MKIEPQNSSHVPLILVCAMWAMGVVTFFVGALGISDGVSGHWKVVRNENGRIQSCPAMSGVIGIPLFVVGTVIVGVGIWQRRRPKGGAP